MALTAIPISGQELSAMGFESITVGATAVGFTAGTITPTTTTTAPARPACRAFVTAETAQMRFTYDGTVPTASSGHLLQIGDSLIIEGIVNVAAARFIRTGTTSGTIVCTYDRHK